jgi:hypothetical protein
MTDRTRILFLPLLVLSFATLIFFSLDINKHLQHVFVADISLKPDTGMLKVAFYANRFTTYGKDSSIKYSADEWEIARFGDTAVLTSRSPHAVLSIKSYGAPLYVSLLRFPEGGTALLRDAKGGQREVDLRADNESIYSFVVGGTDSAVPSVNGTESFSITHYYRAYGLIIAIFSLLVIFHLLGKRLVPMENAVGPAPAEEILGYSTPLIITPLIVQLAFWPASVPPDGGIQWMEAVVPGHLTPAIVIPTTLLFRLFSKISTNPAYVIFAQIILGALGIALVLREIRRRGVSRRITQMAALVLALLPQYPTFIVTLSKDAWNCAGLLITTYAALSLLRIGNKDPRANPLTSMILLILMLLSAIFAGVMRPNTLPAIAVFILLIAIYFGKRMGYWIPTIVYSAYILSAIAAPIAIEYHSAESQTARTIAATKQASGDSAALPLGAYANFYIIHLFATAVNGDAPIAPEDAQIFYAIAPREAWQEYDCSYADKTQMAIARSGHLKDETLHIYMTEHQIDMALITLKLMIQNPGLLLKRQTCVTSILWYIGYHTFPFQVNATLGFDGVSNDFLARVGQNRSLIGEISRNFVTAYVSWSETWTQLWLFWRPFLYMGFGVFSVLLYSLVQKKYDVLLVTTLPMLLTFWLAVFIAFPAYRYQYPATLILLLFFLFSFARPMKSAQTLAAPFNSEKISS